MITWLTENAIWLGSLSAIATILGLILSYWLKSEGSKHGQDASVIGLNNEVRQTKRPSKVKSNQNQNAVVDGDENSVVQKQ